MIESLHLKNFRSFENTGNIELKKLNVFIGANNAGKTSFLSCIELLVRAMGNSGGTEPVSSSEMPSFASFDSVLRRHWSTSEQRPHKFSISYAWNETQAKGRRLKSTLVFRGSKKDDRVLASYVTYDIGNTHIKITPPVRIQRRRPKALVKIDNKKPRKSELFFYGLLPMLFDMEVPALRAFYSYKTNSSNFEVVHPFRPIPKSFYVLDDPSLGAEDRAMLTFLLRIWNSTDKIEIEIKKRLVESLATLGLARKFDVVPVSKYKGPKVIELRVAPGMLRHTVTIADAGFGLSQALPLVACDARLNDGYLVAYQPEVHLHPFSQSRLADIFAKSVQRGNQVFVETHSTDLILRLQTKIVNGEINAKDVRVFCFENINGRSLITPVDFNVKGSPAFPWPAGFIDVSFNLAKELASERIKLPKHAS